MIDPKKRAEIKRLLAEGDLTQVEIAKRTGISLTTVHRIRSGKRHPTDRARGPWREDKDFCQECGVVVQQPCLRCRLLAAGHHATSDTEIDAELIVGLDLRMIHHERYLQVRKVGKAVVRNAHPTGPERRAAPLHHLRQYQRHEPRPREHGYKNPDTDE